MKEIEAEVGYHVLYLEEGRTEWFLLTNTRDLWQHPAEGSAFNRTTDLAEALAAAQGLTEGTVFTDSRPKYQRRVVATQVCMTIITGGVIREFGEPQTDA